MQVTLLGLPTYYATNNVLARAGLHLQLTWLLRNLSARLKYMYATGLRPTGFSATSSHALASWPPSPWSALLAVAFVALLLW